MIGERDRGDIEIENYRQGMIGERDRGDIEIENYRQGMIGEGGGI